jgi:hypothetical protein
MRARSNRLATGILLLFQLMLGTRGLLWTPASAVDAASASSHTEHMPMTGAAHHSAAPTTDGDCQHEQPSDSNAPCHTDMACHAGPPCCGPVLTPALSLRVDTAHVPCHDDRGGYETVAHYVPSRVDHALPLATAPPAVA